MKTVFEFLVGIIVGIMAAAVFILAAVHDFGKF